MSAHLHLQLLSHTCTSPTPALNPHFQSLNMRACTMRACACMRVCVYNFFWMHVCVRVCGCMCVCVYTHTHKICVRKQARGTRPTNFFGSGMSSIVLVARTWFTTLVFFFGHYLVYYTGAVFAHVVRACCCMFRFSISALSQGEKSWASLCMCMCVCVCVLVYPPTWTKKQPHTGRPFSSAHKLIK